jgi:hypothetical protein
MDYQVRVRQLMRLNGLCGCDELLCLNYYENFVLEDGLTFRNNSSTNFPHRQCSLAMHFADVVQSS